MSSWSRRAAGWAASVCTASRDVSQALETGCQDHHHQAGKYKTEGNPYEPLSSEAAAHMQAQADAYYGMFVDAVARRRSVTPATVRGGYGEGRVLMAKTPSGREWSTASRHSTRSSPVMAERAI